MFYLLTSLATATFFGIAMSSLYGSEHLIDHSWVVQSTWAIIVSGISMVAVKPMGCWVYRTLGQCGKWQGRFCI